MGSPYGGDSEEAEPKDGNMILAVRAPPGSTLEIPSETQIKEMYTLTMNKKDPFHGQPLAN